MSTTAEPTTPATADRPKAERIAHNNMIFESVLHIRSAQTLEQFRGEFGSLATQVRQLQSIEQRIQAALTTAEKDALAKVREQEIRDLQSKDSLFQKVYGFSAAGLAVRPHFILNTEVRLLTPVTDEELTKARTEKDFSEKSVVIRDSSKFLHISTINGPAIQTFERDVKVIQANREAAIQLKAQADRLTGEEKTKAEEAFAAAEKKLNEDNAMMAKTYGFSLTRNYNAEPQAGVFFVALTKEEVERAAAKDQVQATEPAKAVEAKKDKPAAKAN